MEQPLRRQLTFNKNFKFAKQCKRKDLQQRIDATTANERTTQLSMEMANQNSNFVIMFLGELFEVSLLKKWCTINLLICFDKHPNMLLKNANLK